MPLWIGLTLMAAFMQSIRTAMQKALSARSSATTTTLARYFYALPLVWIYWTVMASDADIHFNALPARFLVYASLSAVVQIMATWLMVRLFQQRNFAIGVSYAKSEAMLIAVVGFVFLGVNLSPVGWLSVLAGTVGIVLLSPRAAPEARRSLKAYLTSSSALYGISCGLCFALSSLWLRQASLSLHADLVASAATTLAYMISLQFVLLVGYQAIRTPHALKALFTQWPLALGVGVTSLLGSIGWFTAMTLTLPALVKTLGQVEFFFTLIIAMRVFRERFTAREMVGMAALLLSVLGIVNA
ncbi:EamA/RhaT family transporter [Pokkaliibacter sp. CJK22405]|uniref:EamA/RhaT family transporter n=1 Tax=Pokkaliibacter sp. CJK22405 TaxID=3384615 RepID=UPI00398506F4